MSYLMLWWLLQYYMLIQSIPQHSHYHTGHLLHHMELSLHSDMSLHTHHQIYQPCILKIKNNKRIEKCIARIVILCT